MFWVFIILICLSRSQNIANYALPGRPVSGNQLYIWQYSDYYYIYSFFGRNEDGSFSSRIEIIGKRKDEDFSKLSYYNFDFSYYLNGISQFGIFGSYDPDIVYIYGGIFSYGVSSDIFIYNMLYDYFQGYFSFPIGPRFNFAFTTFIDKKNSNMYFFILGGESSGNFMLSDFNIYNFTENSFLNTIKNEFSDVCDDEKINGFAGGQLQYYNGSVYAFSGYVSYTNNDTTYYYTNLCRFSMKTLSWTKENIQNKLIKSESGQSIVIGDSIYYLFGYNDDGASNKTYQLNTSNIGNGWINITSTLNTLSNCKSISSFGIANLDDLVLFYGGLTASNSINSLSYIDLKNNSLWCQKPIYDPAPKSDAKSVQISNFFIVFGGKDANSYYNELWMYTIENDINNWKIIDAYGAYPSPRIGHSMASQGNYVVLVGGISAENIFTSDYWLLQYNDNFFFWEEIVPLSDSPPPISNTCVMVDLPLFYYVGGITPLGPTSQIWMFNLSNGAFTNIYKNPSINGYFDHGCHLDKINKAIYTYYGSLSKSEIPYCFINKFDIANLSDVRMVNQSQTQEMKCRTNFAYTQMDDYVFIVGGQSYLTEAYDDVWKVNFVDYSEEYITHLDDKLYRSSYVSIGKVFYLFSGLSSDGYYDHMDPTSNFVEIMLNSYINDKYCGQGFYYNDQINSCNLCEPGYYSDKQNIDRIPCEPGTYNSLHGATDKTQCLPCPIGNYTSTSGSYYCELCKKGCFPGSKSQSNYNVTTLESYFSNQFPSLATPESDMTFRLVILICFLFLVFIFSIGFITSIKLRVLCSVNDLFQRKHRDRPETEEDEPKSNISYIGGFFTGVALILFATVLTYFLYLLINENRLDTVSLVPATTIIKKSGLKGIGITVKVAFQSYRGSCSSDEIETYPSSGIEVYDKIFRKPISYNETICEIEFKMKKYSIDKKESIFETNDYAVISFIGENSYTSDISVAVECDSAYKGKTSQYPSLLKNTNGFVYKGNDPSIFQFEFMPAYYEDIKYSSTSKEYGYRVSQFDMPIDGSLTPLDEFYLSKGFSIQINLIMSQSGIYTVSNYKTDIIASIGLILGVLSGTIGFTTVIMNMFECAYFNRIKKNEPNRKSIYEIEIERLERIKSIRNSRLQESVN
ncbi:hypothetical protein SteCoe_19583 [Stentor coeruleus]|uniref:Tyrosine-protein kinase ephrin type A/B receptor-like domain-containing protein n=1 Tax=Stentor coeruleus TaxID=5963 RepID=A0A1R2BTY6_9CILI|nr:hypothetical protein SteCoe_19583 [Stentor coeruleus]